MERNKILTKEDIQLKITRIAYQILEDNDTEEEVFLLGIKETGLIIAHKIKYAIEQISTTTKANIIQVNINKVNPLERAIEYSLPVAILKNKVVILTDDVGNTGKTLFYALQPLLTEAPKKIQVALLIDRRHKLFPIHADFVGLSLATTIQEHIEVVMNEAEESAYLQ